MKPGLFEIFLLLLAPAILVLRQLPTFYAISVVVVALSVALIYVKYVIFAQLKRLNLPHDEPTFFFGDMLVLNKKGFGRFGLDGMKKHGKIFGGYFGPAPWIFIADVDILKDIFVKDFANFTNHLGAPLLREPDVTVFSKMVFHARDDKWRNLRSTMTPAFTGGKMKLMIPLMERCVETLVKNMGKESAKNADHGVDIQTFVGGLTMDVICTVALGTETNSTEDPTNPLIINAKKIFDEIEHTFGILLMILFPYTTTKIVPHLTKRLMEGPASAYLVRVTQEILRERKKNPQNRIDMMHLLLSAHQDNDTDEAIEKATASTLSNEGWSQKKHFLTDDEIVANLLLFLIAGYHTTAMTLSFALYLLATNREVQQKCIDELDGIDGQLSYETLQNKLPYLESVIMETLRMYPPVTILTRETCNDYVMANGIPIAAQTPVIIPIYGIHYSEDYYDDPNTFNPDRFSVEERSKRNPLIFLPFGYGPRTCIGMRLALAELKLTLATLLMKFEFSPCAQTEIPLIVDDTHGGILKPKKPIFLAIKARTA